MPLSVTSYIDTAVMVDAQSYYYRVFGVDECSDTSVLGLNARSILLEIDLDSRGKTPMLRWNPYESWANGVLSYAAEVFNEADGIWERVDFIPGTQTEFEDNQTALNQATYCYRIIASEVGGFQALSVSNEQCVTFGQPFLCQMPLPLIMMERTIISWS